MAEIIENTKSMEHMPSNGKVNAALTTGIIGTSLAGLMALGGLTKNGGLLSLFGGQTSGGCGCQKETPCGCNANQTYILDAEELYLERQASANKLEATKQFYEGQIAFNRNLTDGFFAAYERDVKNSFDLYKLSRDQKDELSKRIDEVDKKVDVMAAIRPYQDALINAKIDNTALIADFNLARRTCRMISGELVLPSTPVVSGYASYNPCNCPQANASTGA